MQMRGSIRLTPTTVFNLKTSPCGGISIESSLETPQDIEVVRIKEVILDSMRIVAGVSLETPHPKSNFSLWVKLLIHS
jgi:hypothetical protein